MTNRFLVPLLAALVHASLLRRVLRGFVVLFDDPGDVQASGICDTL